MAAAQLDEAIAELEAFARGGLPLEHYVVNVPPERLGDGSFRVGYPDYQPGMDRLWAALFEAGVSEVTPPAYNAWLATREGPLESAAQVAAVADRDELLVRLFAIRRAERFCDGYWTGVIERGLMLAYARRLRELNSGT